MSSLPLHPAIVHLPLGLAFVMPLIVLGFTWALWTGRIGRRGWMAVVALQLLLVGAGVAAKTTGEREEDRVEPEVPGSALELHEERADQFVWAAAATLAVALLVLAVPRPAAARLVAAVTLTSAVVVTTAAIRVGHAGGQLVYVHNAGAAYATGQSRVRRSEATRLRPRGSEVLGRRGDARLVPRDERDDR
ncbi:MAG: hypothetical protein KJ061_16935 [Vicinamibacteraceae bacterium]|nr:hypothetical protein [Vicinamibacteraceae bacterium]MCL4814179.1 hypothetical protein [Vicinamibacteraceae bacterium]